MFIVFDSTEEIDLHVHCLQLGLAKRNLIYLFIVFDWIGKNGLLVSYLSNLAIMMPCSWLAVVRAEKLMQLGIYLKYKHANEHNLRK